MKEQGPSPPGHKDQRVVRDPMAAGHTALLYPALQRENRLMKVRRVYHQHAISIEPWATLREAAKQMRAGGFSCLPVVSEGQLFGIITERDLVEALSSDEHPERSTVFSHMSEAPETVTPEDDCADAVTKMLSLGCRHLPVMEHGKMVGIVSARDLLPLAATAASV
jgi:CBS domain-containing protein